jgi:hypothetical protein
MDMKIVRTTIAALVVAVLALPAAAIAAPPLTELRPDEFSAADQYKESVPTSRGPRAPAVERRHSSPLSPGLGARLQRQPRAVAARLEKVATSAQLGAPQRKLKSSRDRTDNPSVPTAAISALDGSGSTELLWLLIALLAITGLGVGTAAHRHYQDRKSSDRA